VGGIVVVVVVVLGWRVSYNVSVLRTSPRWAQQKHVSLERRSDDKKVTHDELDLVFDSVYFGVVPATKCAGSAPVICRNKHHTD
jgi:type IV secretory pathway protease TraF